jgi:hypothetical protein
VLNLEQVQTSHGFLPEVKFCANNIKLIIIRPEIIERDKLILKSVGMNESAVDQFFNSSPYAMKEQPREFAFSAFFTGLVAFFSPFRLKYAFSPFFAFSPYFSLFASNQLIFRLFALFPT